MAPRLWFFWNGRWVGCFLPGGVGYGITRGQCFFHFENEMWPWTRLSPVFFLGRFFVGVSSLSLIIYTQNLLVFLGIFMEYYGHLTYLCTILFFAASFGFLGTLFFENFMKIKKPLEKNYYLRFRPTSILELISECVCSTFQNGPFPIIDGGTATSIFRCLCVIVYFTFFCWWPS